MGTVGIHSSLIETNADGIFFMCEYQKENFYAFCPRTVDSYVAERQ